ncbi:MAG: efflux RND transporter periplasmic adaptor subunit [Acidobacteriota bacterium]
MALEARPELSSGIAQEASNSGSGFGWSPRQRQGWKSWGLTLALCGLLALGRGCLGVQRSAAVTPSPAAPPPKVNPSVVRLASLDGIRLEPVQRAAVTTVLRVTGTVELNPQANVVVTPLVSGRIKQVLVTQGTRVRAGQPLVVLDSPEIADLHVRLHDAETRRDIAARHLQRVERDESRVALVQARARLNQAEANFKRMEQLFAAGVLSRQELQDAETAYTTAKAEYDFQKVVGLERDIQEARAALQVATMEVKHIHDQLAALGAPPATSDDARHPTAEITLTAPLSGLVTERMANVGAFVQAGTPLLTVADLRTVWVIAAVPEAQLREVRLGQAVTISTPALGTMPLRGRVAFIEAQINPDTRTARVRIEISNPDERLRAGMFVEVALLSPAPAPQLVIPARAVQRLGSRTVVFVAETDTHEFHLREIEVGAAQDDSVVVRRGLEAGERIVVEGGLALKAQLVGLEAEE